VRLLHRRRSVLAVAAAALLCAMLSGCATYAPADDDSGPVVTVRSFLDARESGDARAACKLMSAGQRLEMVARITADFAGASAAACERLVLSRSPASTATRPDRAKLRTADLEVRFLRAGDRQAASLSPRRALGPQMEVILEHGRWAIDGSAFEKVSFVKQCAGEGGAADRCACLFEQGLRKRGLDIYGPHPPAATVVRAALRDAAGVCAAAATTL
jgi:hypothetical protein